VKRGDGACKVALDEAIFLPQKMNLDLVLLDDALKELARLDERQSRIVELRFFAGLSIDDTSEVLGISHATVEREWASARAWLYREMKPNEAS
jgi:RNA polymerase sigma factor (TIGR02999 family)